MRVLSAGLTWDDCGTGCYGDGTQNAQMWRIFSGDALIKGQNPSVMHSGKETLKCEPLNRGKWGDSWASCFMVISSVNPQPHPIAAEMSEAHLPTVLLSLPWMPQWYPLWAHADCESLAPVLLPEIVASSCIWYVCSLWHPSLIRDFKKKMSVFYNWSQSIFQNGWHMTSLLNWCWNLKSPVTQK